jgi:glycosyltransferase involved in cell wall biosynthesis
VIYIPFDKKFQGGPGTFMDNLKNYLAGENYNIQNDPEKARHIFFPIEYQLDFLKKIQSHKGSIIQRLDGIYYPSKHGSEFIKYNQIIHTIYKHFSTHVIFQSEYSKNQCFEMFGEKKKPEFTVIHNGANKHIFFPENTLPPLDKGYILTTSGHFRNPDMLEPIIYALDQLRDIPFSLNVLGPISKPEIKPLLERPYIFHRERLSLKEIAGYLQKSHIFLYSHLNPPCPNSVIEAISCGLPVVGFKSGAMQELCSFNSDLLAPVSNKIFQEYHEFNPETLKEKILLAISNYDTYRSQALNHTNDFDFNSCGNAYMKVFNKQMKQHHKNPIIRKIYRAL